MDRHESDYLVLRDFLSLPHRAEAVLDRFADLPHAGKEKYREKEGFVYIPGTRENAVLLVAHADTVGEEDLAVELAEDDRIIRNRDSIPGTDDRQNARCCGCSGIPATVCWSPTGKNTAPSVPGF